MWGDLRRDFVIIFVVILTIVFYFTIPMFVAGFPNPVLSNVELTDSYHDKTGQVFSMTSTVTNQGTGGNVVLTTKLVNASRDSLEARSVKTVYMGAGDVITVQTSVAGSTDQPYDIVVEAARKSAFTPGF